jgi:hypothetical protein
VDGGGKTAAVLWYVKPYTPYTYTVGACVVSFWLGFFLMDHLLNVFLRTRIKERNLWNRSIKWAEQEEEEAVQVIDEKLKDCYKKRTQKETFSTCNDENLKV